MNDIRERIEEWRRNLLDLSKRNALVKCPMGNRGAIRLSHPTAEKIWRRVGIGDGQMTFVWKRELVEIEDEQADVITNAQSLFSQSSTHTGTPDEIPTGPVEPHQPTLEECLASPRLQSDHILTELTDRQLDLRLRRLDLRAKESLSEQGVHNLFLVFGMLRWYESLDSDKDLHSPLMLVPVKLDRRSADAPWTVSEYEDEAIPNYSIQQLMQEQFGLELPELPPLSELEAENARLAYLDAVRESVGDNPRWEVQDTPALGTFSFQKIAMWQDLGENWEQISAHSLCRAVAGDDQAAVSEAPDLIPPEEFDDRVSPADLHTIVDCDSSQLEAILAARAGASFVLDGPPGTGKSQTIANLVAEFLADGKAVLFVSEKSAALEVVKRRLDARNLGDFCLECHSHKSNKKQVVEELARCLRMPQEQYKDQSARLEELRNVRQQLNQYVRRLHRMRDPLNITAYQAHGRLARVIDAPASRCEIPNVNWTTAEQLQNIHQLLDKIVDARSVVTNYDQHPWRGCRVTGVSLTVIDDARHHLDQLTTRLDGVAAECRTLLELELIDRFPTPETLNDLLKSLDELLQTPVIPTVWFEHDVVAVAKCLLKWDQTQRQISDLQAQLVDFVDGIEDRFPQPAVEELTGESEWGLRVKPHGNGTVRTQAVYFQALETDLLQLQSVVSSVPILVNEIVQILGVPLLEVPTLKRLRRLVQIGESIAAAGPIRPSWFDAARRDDVRTIAHRCQEDLNEIDPIRQELIGRLSHRAFEQANRELVDRSAPYESFWKRLFGGFRAYRTELQDLYVDDIPAKTTDLLDDLRKLRKYHRRLEVVRQHETERASDLPASTGETDWAEVLRGLDAVAELSRIVDVPDSLKDRLSSVDGLDRRLLNAAVGRLSTQLDNREQVCDDVCTRLAIRQVAPTSCPFDEATLDDLAVWIQAAVEFAGHRTAALRKISDVLREDADALVEKLGNTLAAACSLSESKESLGNVSEQLAKLASVPERSLSAEEVNTAKWVIATVEDCGDDIPAPIRLIATSADSRNVLSGSLKKMRSLLQGEFADHWKHLKSLFPLHKDVSTGLTVASTTIPELVNWLRQLLQALPDLNDWMRFVEARDQCRESGIETLLTEAMLGQVSIDRLHDVFDARFYRLWLDEVYKLDDSLRQFDVDEHERLLQQFRSLDREMIDAGFCRIRQKLLNDQQRPHAEMLNVAASSEMGILQRECNKQRRHLPLRMLFQKIPRILLRLKPCVMMSPLAVSTYLNSDEIRFDLVIFDEASQVRPFDAVSAIYRGRQLVVAGDQKQLPPTSFFDRSVDDDGTPVDEEETGIGRMSDYESVLDVCLSMNMPRKRLRWHYRSKREPLIAFSNHHFYDNDLVTFPSVLDGEGQSAVIHDYVPDGRWKSGAGFNEIEAGHVAHRIVQHFQQQPGKSLGVITFNQRQQFAVNDKLEEIRRQRPELEQFFSDDQLEPLLIKNLENVQGDERDVVFLSMGYGKDQHGKFYKRFGPINQQGGERRLNVAVTRARERLVFISSVRTHDMDIAETSKRGAHLLKAYMEYAERGVDTLGKDSVVISGAEFDSPFEAEVHAELTREGFDVRSQIGCGGYRIDLGIVHPQEPGRFILGIECDGASYHSSKTARDRDRLRQLVLEENLGWNIQRIWSTDWIRDRTSQIDRIRRRYSELVAGNGRPLDDGEADEHPSPTIEPTFIVRTPEEDVRPTYDNIDEVSDVAIAQIGLDILNRHGATEPDDLTRQIARHLGFARTGKRIRTRIDSILALGLQRGSIARQPDGRLTSKQRTPNTK